MEHDEFCDKADLCALAETEADNRYIVEKLCLCDLIAEIRNDEREILESKKHYPFSWSRKSDNAQICAECYDTWPCESGRKWQRKPIGTLNTIDTNE